MPAVQTITLIQSGNRMVVDPTTPAVYDLLAPELTFQSKRLLYGRERFLKQSRVELSTSECFSQDHRRRLATSLGFYDRCVSVLSRAGYRVLRQELDPPEQPERYQPLWDRAFDPKWGIKLRHGQDEFLVRLASRLQRRLPCRFDCPPGFGKTFAVGLIGLLYPKLRIDVVTDRVPVVERIHAELCQWLPDVGIITGAHKRRRDARVRCYSVDSLHHSDGEADLLIGDECHEFASDASATRLAAYHRSVNVGLSATHNMRLDNKDMRVEAMFGPVVYKIPYAEAAAHGMVVPIRVEWTDVVMDFDPTAEAGDDSVERKRLGFWRNGVRNEIIAANARADAADGLQQLITCETIEHAFALAILLPGFELVYAADAIDASQLRYLRKEGLWPASHEPVTPQKKRWLTKMFEDGKLRSVIATTVWNVGVNFKQLQVLNRADGGGSPIMDTQIPGRVSRINADKPYGLVRDYRDQFSKGFRQRARSRQRNYEAHGWTQADGPNPGAAPGLPVVAVKARPPQFQLDWDR